MCTQFRNELYITNNFETLMKNIVLNKFDKVIVMVSL